MQSVGEEDSSTSNRWLQQETARQRLTADICGYQVLMSLLQCMLDDQTAAAAAHLTSAGT